MKMAVENVTNRQVLVWSDSIAGDIAKIPHQSDQVGLAHQGKELVNIFRLVPELTLQRVEIGIKISRYGKAGAVRKMEAVHGIHFYPFGGDAQLCQQRTADGGRIAQQRVEVSCGVESVSLAAKGTAIPADHEVLLNQ